LSLKEKGAAPQEPGSKATGKCTCKGNPSQKTSTLTEDETSPGEVTGPAEKRESMITGWAPSPTGSPWSKNVDPLAGRPEEIFDEGDVGGVCQTGRVGQAEGSV